jgi:hypothetical protein
MTVETSIERPPLANRAQWISAICSIFTAIAAVVGVISFYDSTQREKIKAAQDAVARLYPLDTELSRFLTDTPGLRGCLRKDPDGTQWKKLEGEDLEKFQGACAMAGNMFEYYLLVRPNIEDHDHMRQIIVAWNNYLADICRNSDGFREYIKSNRDVWSEPFRNEFDKHTQIPPAADAPRVGKEAPRAVPAGRKG